MKNIFKRSVSIFTLTVMVTSLFTACAEKKENAQTASGAAANTQEAKGEPTKIRWFNRVNATVVLENNPVIAEVEKRANVKLIIEAPPINNYLDKLQIVMASGDIPNLVYAFGADNNYESWIKNGLLAQLDDKISKYPNLSANITKEMWDSVKSTADGKIYQVPRPNVENHMGYRINQQWLDKLGLKAPETVEEFIDVARAFTKNDPDGNGKNDTYGVSFAGASLGLNSIWNSSNYLLSAYNMYMWSGIKDTDGKYKIREKMNGYIPYLTFIRQLNEEKIIDPEFPINKTYGEQDKQDQNKVGIVYGSQYSVMAGLKNIPDSDKKYTFHAPLKNSEGVVNDYVAMPVWGGWLISKNSKNIDGVLKFLDWGNTQEAVQLLQLGLKGLTYDDYDAGKRLVTRTPDQSTKLTTVTSTYMTLANAFKGQSSSIEYADTPERLAKYNKDWDAAKKVLKSVNVPAVRAPKLSTFNSTNPDLVKKKDDMEMKYVLGNITLQQFKDFLDKEWFPATADAEKEYAEVMSKVN